MRRATKVSPYIFGCGYRGVPEAVSFVFALVQQQLHIFQEKAAAIVVGDRTTRMTTHGYSEKFRSVNQVFLPVK